MIEIVLALVILAIISTTLFAIINGAIKGSADLERNQRENDQINRFLELCRLTFQTMPSSATLSLKSLDSSGLGPQELTIAGVPSCFGFGTIPTSYEDTTLGLRQSVTTPTNADGSARYTLSITRKDILGASQDPQNVKTTESSDPEMAADEKQRTWLPLLPGVSAWKWRFWKESSDEWLEEWTDTKWPDMIELQLTLDGRTNLIRALWTPPELQLRAGKGGSSSSSSTQKSTTTTTGGGGTGR